MSPCPIDRRREIDFCIGIGPERSVLVVKREDSHRGTRTHVESTGDGQEVGGEMTIGQLRHRHVGRQARLEEGSERLRHADKEAQRIYDGHRKEVAYCVGGAQVAFLTDQVTDVDVTLDHPAVKGRDDRFERNERFDVPDLLLRFLEERRMGFQLLLPSP